MRAVVFYLQPPGLVTIKSLRAKVSEVVVMGNGHKAAVSEVIDISPDNLYSNLCFIQPSVSHDVLSM